MTLKITKMLVKESKYSIKCPYKMDAETVTMHETENDASAMSEISYMIGNNNYVSYHVAVDDTRAVQGIPYNRNAYHAGDGKNGPGNRKSIAIEICYSKTGGERYEKSKKNAAKMAALLLKDRGWGVSKLRRHKDWSGKNCPRRIIATGWSKFKNMVQTELNLLNQPKVNIKDVKDFKVKIKCNSLNIRKGPGTEYSKLGAVKKNYVYTIVKTNADGTWGLLKAGPKAGSSWISIRDAYVTKVK